MTKARDTMSRMKKILLAYLLISNCLLVACSRQPENHFYFIAKVVDLRETTILVEVTHSGNRGGNIIGYQVTIPTNKNIAEILVDNPTMILDNYLRLEFDGVFLESSPAQLHQIYKVEITNENGEVLE